MGFQQDLKQKVAVPTEVIVCARVCMQGTIEGE